MTYRRVASHIRGLPDDSNYKTHLRREDGRIWDQPDHHRQDVVDLLAQILYYLQTGTLTQLSKRSDRQRVIRKAPQRPLRPGEKKEKPKMTPKEDLRVFFSHA